MNAPKAVRWVRSVFTSCLCAALLTGSIFFNPGQTSSRILTANSAPLIPETSQSAALEEVLVDDFTPLPLQGQTDYYYNRLGGDRGALNNSNWTVGGGKMTVTIGSGANWGGVWFSLNHVEREHLGFNFSAVLPPQILSQYQSSITGIAVKVAGGTSGRKVKLELKDGANILWESGLVTLTGGAQTLSYALPALGNISLLTVVLDQAQVGDQVILDNIALTATTQITDPLEAVFVWSYGMLLNNWNPDTGLVRDKATDASGEFDAVQCTGALAAATAVAEQLGVISRASAVQIVTKIEDTLLDMNKIPRYKGLWPHWVKKGADGKFDIVTDTEWSSVDTVIAAVGLLDAQVALDLDPARAIQFLQEIDWNALKLPGGISHGYTYSKQLIPYSWDTFGGESVMVDLVYAAVMREVPPLQYPLPPTANGSGFIDEISWLFLIPPSGKDIWGADWPVYRVQAVDTQLSYYHTYHPGICLDQLGLFGLSAGEVPTPSDVPVADVYQAFGVGGGSAPRKDWVANLDGPVALPHYPAMAASLKPLQVQQMWAWLVDGPFSPLNNVESLLFPTGSSCDRSDMQWNHLKGSWNLALQALGLGRQLAARSGKVYDLWPPSMRNQFLRAGYDILYPLSLRYIWLPVILKSAR